MIRLASTGLVLMLLATSAPADQRRQGYLGESVQALAAAIPPPPSAGSPEGGADRAAFARSLSKVGSPEWKRAIGDTAERAPEMVARMRCATRRQLEPGNAPTLFSLIGRARSDLAIPVRTLKDRHGRPRPYAGDLGASLCEPVPPERRIQTSPSYPSGHAAAAALTGYILASLVPERAPEIIARARQYGEARVVCRVHHPSDVRASQSLAAAVFARLQSEPQFRKDWQLARTEILAIPERPSLEPCDRS